MDRQAYTVGWICAVKTDYVVACELLDEEYPPLPSISAHDGNAYTLGRIHDHHVVVACLPKGRHGIASAATVAKDMLRSFESIRIGLMVGTAGGATSQKHDIRLGDVVVGCPVGRTGGVLPYKYGKELQDKEFEITGSLNSPPTFLLTALNQLDAIHERKGHHIAETVRTMVTKNPRVREKYRYPGAERDRFYEPTFTHVSNTVKCDTGCGRAVPPVIQRPPRSPNPDDPVVHYGIIASADQLMKDAITRDKISQEHDVVCFEMEAAGLSNDFPCVVVRGICNYSDSHNYDEWQGYAAATAASYAKELLQTIPRSQVAGSQRVIDVVSSTGLGTAEQALIKYLLESEKFRVPFQLTGLPVAAHFVDRDAETGEMEEHLLATKVQNGRKIHILHGLGGIGKTQLAIAYARKHQHTYSAIVWVNGYSRDTVLQSLAAFGRHAGVGGISVLTANTTQRASEMEAEAGAVLGWLALERNCQWLMIFDNVDQDVQSDEDVHAYDVLSFMPPADHGSVLITTRLPSLGDIGTSTEITRLKYSQALELLSNRSGLHRSSSGIDKLVKRLGYLPLALVQAGTYMRATKTGYSKYLELYETSWSQLVAETPRLRDYENGSVQTTWMISYKRIQKGSPAAAQFLQLWAYLDHQDIWYELISRGSEGCRGYDWLQELAQSEISFKRVMKALLDYSLIESRQDGESYSIHPVVHDWCAGMISSSKDDLMIAALTIVGNAAPDQSEAEYWISQQRLLPHADRCVWQLHCIDLLDSSVSAESCDAFHYLGDLYADQGKLAKAEKMYRRALEGKEKVWGPDHTPTLDTVNNLGLLLADQWKHAEAEKMYRWALDGYEKAWGPDHISTLDTVNNLGNLSADQSKYSEAENMYRRALDGKEKAWGPDHIFTLNTVNNLGLLYADQGKHTEAEKMYRRALDGKEKAWGPDHVSTLNTVNNLGLLYADQGKHIDAENMYRRALDGKEKAWGLDHTSTLNTVNNLGLLYKDQGKYTEAEKMYRRVLDGYEKAWGPDHPSTLHTIHNLRLLNASRDGHIKGDDIHLQALDRSDGVKDNNQHLQSPLSKGKAILERLHAGMRRRKGPFTGE